MILHTPIAQLELAIKGAWDFALDTNPWVKRAPPAPPRQSPGEVARSVRDWFRRFAQAPASKRVVKKKVK